MRPAVTNSFDRAFEFGHRLGYRGKSKEGLLKFLKNVPADELVEGLSAYHRYLQLVTSARPLERRFSHKLFNLFSFPKSYT